jgi:glycosyltransferase involved in cell wall biosynthesis
MRDKIKVLQLGKQYHPHLGGIEKTMQQMAEGIQDKVDSYVLATQDKGEAYNAIINGVPVHYAKSWGIVASMPISFDLIMYLRKHSSEYDIIHLHMPFPLGDLACLLSGFKGKLILYWHSDVVRQKKMMLFYKPLMNWTLKRADAIAVATQGNINGSPYIKRFEKKCVLIPFGLRKEWEEKSDKYWISRLDHKGDINEKLHLLFIGRLVYYKGCDILINAMAKLKELPIDLTIIGSGAMEEELKKRTIQLGLGEKVNFKGRVSDEEMEREITNCDVFVFPSVANSEAFGLVQLEVMAYGKPVINTSLATGVPWVSLNGINGLTVPPLNSQALADAIRWMWENPAGRREMGINARERVKSEFNHEKMIGQILELYNGLVSER